jgi:hypothetical protein
MFFSSQIKSKTPGSGYKEGKPTSSLTLLSASVFDFNLFELLSSMSSTNGTSLKDTAFASISGDTQATPPRRRLRSSTLQSSAEGHPEPETLFPGLTTFFDEKDPDASHVSPKRSLEDDDYSDRHDAESSSGKRLKLANKSAKDTTASSGVGEQRGIEVRTVHQ